MSTNQQNQTSPRRVSFASETQVREFNEDDTMLIDGSSVADLYEEAEPAFDSEAMNTPSRSSFTSRAPRPDIFGSPRRRSIISPYRPTVSSPLRSMMLNTDHEDPIVPSSQARGTKRSYEDQQDDGEQSDGSDEFPNSQAFKRRLVDTFGERDTASLVFDLAGTEGSVVDSTDNNPIEPHMSAEMATNYEDVDNSLNEPIIPMASSQACGTKRSYEDQEDDGDQSDGSYEFSNSQPSKRRLLDTFERDAASLVFDLAGTGGSVVNSADNNAIEPHMSAEITSNYDDNSLTEPIIYSSQARGTEWLFEDKEDDSDMPDDPAELFNYRPYKRRLSNTFVKEDTASLAFDLAGTEGSVINSSDNNVIEPRMSAETIPDSETVNNNPIEPIIPIEATQHINIGRFDENYNRLYAYDVEEDEQSMILTGTIEVPPTKPIASTVEPSSPVEAQNITTPSPSKVSEKQIPSAKVEADADFATDFHASAAKFTSPKVNTMSPSPYIEIDDRTVEIEVDDDDIFAEPFPSAVGLTSPLTSDVLPSPSRVTENQPSSSTPVIEVDDRTVEIEVDDDDIFVETSPSALRLASPLANDVLPSPSRVTENQSSSSTPAIGAHKYTSAGASTDSESATSVFNDALLSPSKTTDKPTYSRSPAAWLSPARPIESQTTSSPTAVSSPIQSTSKASTMEMTPSASTTYSSPARPQTIESPRTIFSPRRTFFAKKKDKEGMNDPSEQVALSDFLSYAGVMLDKEVPVTLDESDIDDLVAPNERRMTVPEQVTANVLTTPEIEMYQTAAIQLNEKSNDCRLKIEESTAKADERNPAHFIDFLEGTVDERNKIEADLQKLLRFSKAKAGFSWYELWLKQFNDFVEAMELEKVSHDQTNDILLNLFQRASQQNLDLKTKLTELKKLKAVAEKKQEKHSIDLNLLKKYETEIDQQKNLIGKLNEKSSRLQEKMREMKSRRGALDEEQAMYDEQINNAEDFSGKIITEEEMISATKKYMNMLKAFKTRVSKVGEDVINFSLYGQIDVTIDQKKLNEHSSEAIVIRVPETVEKELGPFIEFIYGLKDAIADTWDEDEIAQQMLIYWNRVRLFIAEIEQLQTRFITKVTPITNQGCYVESIIYSNGMKFGFDFAMNAQIIIDHPTLDDYIVRFYRDADNHEEMVKILDETLSKHGTSNLAKHLQEVANTLALL